MKRLLVVLSISLFLCACGGGGSTGTTNASTALPITVSVSPSAQTALDQGQTLAFNATVSNDVQSQGVKWSVSGAACSGSACGTLTNTTNTTATYNTPASVTSSLTVKVTATSIADTTKSAASTAVINPAPAVTTTTLASGIAGTVYNATLAATGGTGNLTWGLVSGSAVPAGLNLSNSGALSGTPTAAGTSTFTVTVTDSAATPVAVQKQLAITVNAPLAVTTASLSSGVVDSTYSASLASSGGAASVSWSLAPGSSLPANLTLSGSGTISGIPTAAGTTNFTVVATDSGKPTPQTAKQQLSITIDPAPLSITTATLATGMVGVVYSASLTASGGTTSYTWSLAPGSSLPAGLTLSTSGVIAGPPSVAGTARFTVTVADSGSPQQSQSEEFSLTINPSLLAVTTSSPLPNGSMSVAYTDALTASGGTPSYTWNWAAATGSSLPPGLQLSTAGTISGTPTATGTFSFNVTATDSGTPTPQTAQQSMSLTVAAAPCGSGNEALLSGQYAFLLQGFNGTGFLAVDGAFAADGTGKISGGEADTNGALGSMTSNIDPTNSSYAVGSDNRGCATIATTFGTFTTRFVLGSVSGTAATQGRIIEFEPATSSANIASGEILQQDTNSFAAGLSGNYVFGLTGWDFNNSVPADVAGVLNAGGGFINSFEEDFNDGGGLWNLPPGDVTGSYPSFDTFGRSTLTYTSSYGPAAVALYMANASKLLYLLTGGSPVVSGELQQQVVPPAGFSASSVSGNMVLYGHGTFGASSADSFMAVVNSTGSGNLTVSMYEDNGANNANNGTGWQSLQSAATFTCSYTIDGSGRMTLSGAATQCASAPLIYLSGANAGVVLGQNIQMVQFGAVEPQANITFNSSALAGNFFMGPLSVINQSQPTEVDQLALASGSATSISDLTSTTHQQVDGTNTFSYTVNADGTVTTLENGVPVVQMIVINNNRYVMLNNITDVYPYIVIGQQ